MHMVRTVQILQELRNGYFLLQGKNLLYLCLSLPSITFEIFHISRIRECRQDISYLVSAST
jgi:hypothetical protein